MARADTETSATGHERSQANREELMDRGGTRQDAGRGEAPPGAPDSAAAVASERPDVERDTPGGTGGEHGTSLTYGGTGGGSRYGETTGLVGYDIGSGKDPQEMNTPPSAPRDQEDTEGVHQESGPETTGAKGR